MTEDQQKIQGQTQDWTSQSLGPNVASHLRWGAFSRDTRRAAIATSSGSIHVYDFESEPREIELQEIGGNFYSVALSNNGRWLAGGASGIVRVWDLKSRRLAAMLRGHVHGVFSLCFSPDDRTLVSFNGTKAMFWNVDTWQELMRFYDDVPARLTSNPRIEFSPDGRYLVRVGTPIGKMGNQFRIWPAPDFSDSGENTTSRSQKTVRVVPGR